MTVALVDLCDLVGVPYRLDGRDPRRGLDCVGLVLEVQRRLGIPAKEPLEHAIDAVRAPEAIVRNHLPRGWDEVAVPLQQGDLVLMAEGFSVSHAGVAVDSSRVIHASHSLGVVIVSFSAIVRSGVLHSIWRYHR